MFTWNLAKVVYHVVTVGILGVTAKIQKVDCIETSILRDLITWLGQFSILQPHEGRVYPSTIE